MTDTDTDTDTGKRRELKSVTVANALRTRIAAGEFPEGTPLIMNKLAAEYGVSPGTVCGALSDLGREGLVYLDSGDGRWHVARLVMPS